jgi:hypothetical protein
MSVVVDIDNKNIVISTGPRKEKQIIDLFNNIKNAIITA